MADKSPRKQNRGKKLTTKEKQARKKAKMGGNVSVTGAAVSAAKKAGGSG